METLNAAQLEILKMFRNNQNEEELKELKKVLLNFLANQLQRQVDKVWEEKGYTNETVEQWKNEHFRIKST
ncbi:hypothetical protein BH10BAC3_BH10BAC3_41120 [soil metagenome]